MFSGRLLLPNGWSLKTFVSIENNRLKLAISQDEGTVPMLDLSSLFHFYCECVADEENRKECSIPLIYIYNITSTYPGMVSSSIEDPILPKGFLSDTIYVIFTNFQIVCLHFDRNLTSKFLDSILQANLGNTKDPGIENKDLITKFDPFSESFWLEEVTRLGINNHSIEVKVSSSKFGQILASQTKVKQDLRCRWFGSRNNTLLLSSPTMLQPHTNYIRVSQNSFSKWNKPKKFYDGISKSLSSTFSWALFNRNEILKDIQKPCYISCHFSFNLPVTDVSESLNIQNSQDVDLRKEQDGAYPMNIFCIEVKDRSRKALKSFMKMHDLMKYFPCHKPSSKYKSEWVEEIPSQVLLHVSKQKHFYSKFSAIKWYKEVFLLLEISNTAVLLMHSRENNSAVIVSKPDRNGDNCVYLSVIYALIKLQIDPFYRSIEGFWKLFSQDLLECFAVNSFCPAMFSLFMDALRQIVFQFPHRFNFHAEFLEQFSDLVLGLMMQPVSNSVDSRSTRLIWNALEHRFYQFFSSYLSTAPHSIEIDVQENKLLLPNWESTILSETNVGANFEIWYRFFGSRL